MARHPIQFSKIQDEFDFVSCGMQGCHTAFLCLETGAFYSYSEDGDNEESPPDDIDVPGKYIAVPHRNDLNLGRALVMEFVGSHLPDALDKVHEIFSRAGAYARFKDLLDHQVLLQQWYDFEEKACEAELRLWCEGNGIEVID